MQSAAHMIHQLRSDWLMGHDFMLQVGPTFCYGSNDVAYNTETRLASETTVIIMPLAAP